MGTKRSNKPPGESILRAFSFSRCYRCVTIARVLSKLEGRGRGERERERDTPAKAIGLFLFVHSFSRLHTPLCLFLICLAYVSEQEDRTFFSLSLSLLSDRKCAGVELLTLPWFLCSRQERRNERTTTPRLWMDGTTHGEEGTRRTSLASLSIF